MCIRTLKNIALLIALALLFACGGDSPDRWRKFATKTTRYEVPHRWVTADPYTIKEVYWKHVWFRYFPPNHCRMALFKSFPADQNQFFVAIGPKDDLWPPIERNITLYNQDPTVQSIKRYMMRTRDGVDVTLYVANRRSTGFDAEDVSLLLGFAEFDGKVFMMNGGGRSARWDIGLIENFLNTLVLGD